MNNKKSAHIIISGKVQGVYFRVFTRETARVIKLTGWVKNKSDGTVAAFAAGTEEQLNKFIKELKKGPPASRVDDIHAEWSSFGNEFSSFEIRY